MLIGLNCGVDSFTFFYPLLRLLIYVVFKERRRTLKGKRRARSLYALYSKRTKFVNKSIATSYYIHTYTYFKYTLRNINS